MSSITAILNVYRRPQNLELQIKSLTKQTVVPTQIWAWRNYHEDGKELSLSSVSGLNRWFDSNYNWKYYGRFAGALLADTEFVAIFDDDTVPGSEWFENCLKTIETHNGILGTAGVILNSKIYADHFRCGWPTRNEKTERVDLVGHAWFFRREWLKFLWMEKPFTWDNAEDIQFSYLAQKYGGIETFCPPHPPSSPMMHGSLLAEKLGVDNKASSCNPNKVEAQKFTIERDLAVENAIKNGWKTIKGVQL